MTLDFVKDKKHIDLTKYYEKLGIKKDLVNIGFDGSLIIKDEEYYVKFPKSELRIYTELIAAKLLQKLNIPHVDYYLVSFFDESGLISKSFKKPGAKYISGQKLLDDYRDYLQKSQNVIDMNNLETIWNAIEYYYRQKYPREKVQVITATLMRELTTMFSFDIAINNVDRHQSNWIIEESDSSIHLVPIFDNEFMLDSYLDPESLDSFSLGIDYDDTSNFTPTEESIKKYLDYSSQEFIAKLLLIINLINPEVFIKCLEEVEKAINCPLPEDYKELLINSYQNHHQTLIKLLNESLVRK